MADGGTILTWNVANWITVILMAAFGFAILGTIMKVYQQRVANGGSQ